MPRLTVLLSLLVASLVVWSAGAQLLPPEPVFAVRMVVDRDPAVAGESLRLALVLTIDRGWHINTDQPGDEFSLPTTVEWRLPEGWPQPAMEFPDGERLRFAFADTPIEVWEGQVVILATTELPAVVSGPAELAAVVTAQACNDRQCLAPVPLAAKATVEVAPAGSDSRAINDDVFPAQNDEPGRLVARDSDASRLEGLSFPLLMATVFIAGLALNLTPCVYPLIPITVGFFAQQAKQRAGGSFGLAVTYVLGMSITYSVLGVVAALTGRLFGAALQSPLVIGVIVAVVLALAASMFGLWELRVPGWAMRASGARAGAVGALLMGLIVGFVAAPCIGPFVLGLLTFVGQRGDPLVGLALFFTLAMGLGLPYLVLGTFTGAVNRLPASGAWMIGIRRVFGVLLVALAVYFARSLLPGNSGSLLMGVVLIAGGLYLLVVDRTGHEQPTVDRFMRLISLGLVVVGLAQVPRQEGPGQPHLEWRPYDAATVEAAIAAGGPVIVDFYADWCAPCRELDEKTFSDPQVVAELAAFSRFKLDQTTSTPAGDEAALRYEVMGMPTVIVFHDGTEQFRITGFEPPERFLARIR